MSALLLFMFACGDVVTENEPVKETPAKTAPVNQSTKPAPAKASKISLPMQKKLNKKR